MSYANTTDFEQRLTEERFKAIYGEDIASAQSDLDSASAEIDIMLSRRYQVPVNSSSTASILKSWCLTLSEELAYSRNINSKENEKIKSRVENVRKLLSEIGKGDGSLPGATEKDSSSAGAVFVKGDAPIFTTENLRGF